MRNANNIIVIILIMLISTICFGSIVYDPLVLREGDIIFQESMSEQAKALKLATKSRYTHVGILFKINNKWYVLEAIQPVKYTLLPDFINRGRNKHYVIKRIKNSESILTREKIHEMKIYGETFLNKNYDLYFEWNDKRIYCTELVWKIYKKLLHVEVGKLQYLRDFDLTNPFVKKMLKDRYGNNIPYNELVISPKAMYEADNLETITLYN